MNLRPTSKMITLIAAVALMAVLFSSCSRGGHGCPYELQAATDCIIKLR